MQPIAVQKATCKLQNNMRCSQQACFPRKRTPHTAPQVNDYPLPMTPIAATAREIPPNPPLEQTSQIASPEAG
jgi:hypothetical protein